MALSSKTAHQIDLVFMVAYGLFTNGYLLVSTVNWLVMACLILNLSVAT